MGITYLLDAEIQEVNQNVRKQNAILIAIKNGSISKAEFSLNEDLISKERILEIKRDTIEEKRHQESICRVKDLLLAIKDKPNVTADDIVRTFKRAVEENERPSYQQREPIEDAEVEEG